MSWADTPQYFGDEPLCGRARVAVRRWRLSPLCTWLVSAGPPKAFVLPSPSCEVKPRWATGGSGRLGLPWGWPLGWPRLRCLLLLLLSAGAALPCPGEPSRSGLVLLTDAPDGAALRNPSGLTVFSAKEQPSCHSVIAERLLQCPRSMFHVEQDWPHPCFT